MLMFWIEQIFNRNGKPVKKKSYIFDSFLPVLQEIADSFLPTVEIQELWAP